MTDRGPSATSPTDLAPVDRARERQFVEAILRAEADAVRGLLSSLGEDFHRAVDLIVRCAQSNGTVLVTGLGKSGLIGAKIAATFSSLGVPSHPVHPSEAAHGDLGRFRPTDTVLCISFSGETDEVVNLASIIRQDGLPIISITGGSGDRGSPVPPTSPSLRGEAGAPTPPPSSLSSLERLATVSLSLGVTCEAGGPDFVAPTCSTTATLALGDALALAAARRLDFTEADFARRHPGGSLGDLLRPITEVLRFVAGRNMPLLPHEISVREALARAAEVGRRPGALILIDPRTGKLSGIFTDADLRRLILRDPRELDQPIDRVMTHNPGFLPHTARVADAVRAVREFRRDEFPVVDADGKPVGLLDVQDLIAMRLVKD